MDRRDVIVCGAAGTIAAAFGSSSALASPPTPLVMLDPNKDKRVIWGPDTLTNPHAKLVSDWINQRVEDRVLRTRGTWVLLSYNIQLTDPMFLVRAAPVWSFDIGDTEEPGLSICVSERGVELGRARVSITERGYAIKNVFLGDASRARLLDMFPANHIQLEPIVLV